MSIQYSRGRPWAFIGGGGRFVYVYRQGGGWTLCNPRGGGMPVNSDRSGCSALYMLDAIATEWERVPADSKQTRISSDALPFLWGRSMTPVFKGEQINLAIRQEDMKYE